MKNADKLVKHEEEIAKAEKELGIEKETEKEITGYLIVGEENIVKLSDGSIIEFDTGTLTGRMILQLKDKYFSERRRKAGIVPDIDDHYYLLVAERMTGRKLSELMDLKARDFRAVVTFVRDFLTED